MDDEIAIKVDNLEKTFKLPHERAGSVKHLFINFFRHKRSYEKQKVLEDISFEIKKGEFFGIVGRNGSGKSTLLKLLAGIYSPDKGHIQVNGKLVPFIELGVGFNPELTGRENVYLNGGLLGFSGKEVDGFYDEVVEFAELEKFMDQKLKNYSSGMQVRLAFAMAVRAKADALLIDEVLAVGDADFQKKCFEYFSLLKRNKKTVVFVSHDMAAIREYCDKAILLEKSEIVTTGSAEKVSQAYTRQFNKRESKNFDGEQKRWGEGSVVFEKIESKVSGDKITITQHIKANSAVENYIPGIRIRNMTGIHITGTNTKIEKIKVPDLQKGSKVILSWTFDNVFSSGKYFVDPAILLNDGVSVSDWWDEADTFTVKRKRDLPYPVDRGFKVSVKSSQ